MEFVVNNEKEIAVTPKGTKVQIMGCSYTTLEDARVDGMQSSLDQVLKCQEDLANGQGIVGRSFVQPG